MFTNEDAAYLSRALYLAKMGMSGVQPNPLVGAICVKDGQIIGEGYHTAYGRAHAEPEAIRQVKNSELLNDATLYVTLEPCNHQGKTPACTELIISSGIKRVVVGMTDPHPLVKGSGIKRLRSAGIHVDMAPDAKPFEQLNKIFLHNIRTKKAWCTLKWAEDAQGIIGDKEKTLHISSEASKSYTHSLRAHHQAILIGVGTALADRPMLNTRFYPGHNPLKIIMDPEAIAGEYIKSLPLGERILWCTLKADDRHPGNIVLDELLFTNVNEFLTWLFLEEKISSVLVEGGAFLLNIFIKCEAWNEIIVLKNQYNREVKDPVWAPETSHLGIEDEVFSICSDRISIFRFNQ